jgi:hypothetical protein
MLELMSGPVRDFPRLRFSRIQRADVLLLENERSSWPELKFLAQEFRMLELPTSKPAYEMRAFFSILFVAARKSMRPGYAQMGCLAKRSGAKLLLATEGGHREHIAALNTLMPDLPQVLISHGSIRVDNISSARIHPNNENQLLVAWGEADLDTYKKSKVKPPNIVVAGSLRNSIYWARHRQGKPPLDKIFPISLVSNFADSKEESDSRPIRSKVLRLMKDNLARYCRERKLPVRILLRPGLSGQPLPGAKEREIQHFKEVFSGVPLSFSDTSKPYVTYLESDQSEVTIGVPSGSLTESFARGNKVLMISQLPSTGDYLGFPRDGLYLLHEPSYKAFAERLDAIRDMSTGGFADKFHLDREYVVANATSDLTAHLILDLIRAYVTTASK